MSRTRKHWLWIIPIMIILVLMSLHYLYQLNNELQLPNKGWSRSIHLPINTMEGKEYVYKDKARYHLYTYTNKTITYTKLNDDLKLIVQAKYDFPDKIVHIYWGRGTSFIFKSDLDVYYFNGESETLLAKDAGPTATDGKNLFYAKGTKLYQVDVNTKKSKIIGSYAFPIQTLFLGKDHNLLLTTQNVDRNRAYFHFVTMERGQIHSYPFANYILGENAHVSQDSSYTPLGDNIGIQFTVVTAKGGVDYLNYYVKMPYQKIMMGSTKELHPLPIMIYEAKSGFQLHPMDISFSFRKNKPTLLFVAAGFRTKREQSVLNIYEAHLNVDGKWEAGRRSTTSDMTISPFWLGDDAIGWYSYTKKGVFQIEAASSKPTVIKESLKLNSEDYSTALSNTFLSLARVLMLMLMSLMFGVGGLMVYSIIAFTKVIWIDNDVPIVKWLIIAAFLLGELELAHQVMSPTFTYFAPSYLVFPGNFLVVTLITTALSFLIIRMAKTAEWGMLPTVTTFATLYIVITSFLIGPYYI